MTATLHETTIERFLTDLAARTPVPGGGAVAGLVTATAASLGGMVVAWSLGKASLAADIQHLLPVCNEAVRDGKWESELLQSLVA